MKIVYFYQYFSTPKGSWGTRVYEIAKNWVEKGYEVEVVSSIYAKSDLTADKLVEVQNIDGIKVRVINIKIDNKQHTLKRMWTFLAFMLISTYYAFKLKADRYVVSSGPITLGVIGLILKRIRRKDVTLEVRDIWPDTAIEMGVLKNKALIKIFKKLELSLYKSLDRVVALSPGMKREVLERGGKRVISIPNIANLDLFKPRDKGAPKPEIPYGIYYGNLGKINNTGMLISLAQKLNENELDFDIVLVGDGPMAKDVQAAALDNPNLTYLGLMPKTELIHHVQNASLSFVPLSDKPILNTSSPNKLFEALACGIPVLQNTTGWIKELLDINKIGFTFHADDVEGPFSLIQKIIEGELDPEINKRCRQIAEQEFDKNILAEKYLDFITQKDE